MNIYICATALVKQLPLIQITKTFFTNVHNVKESFAKHIFFLIFGCTFRRTYANMRSLIKVLESIQNKNTGE